MKIAIPLAVADRNTEPSSPSAAIISTPAASWTPGTHELVGPPAARGSRDQRAGRVDDEHVGDADGSGSEQAPDEQRAAPDGSHDERLEQAALRVPADDAQRQEGGQHGSEEERPEHREPEERPAGELLLVDRKPPFST